MGYRYLDDFRRGISVFAIFSYGIAVLGTPQCPPPSCIVGLIQQEDNWTGTDPHRTAFHRFTEIGLIFHYKIFR